MTTSYRRPWFAPVLVALVLSCSQGSSSSGGGCGSASATATCEIDTTATTCPGKITLECHDGALPFSPQCEQALAQDTDVLYCCDNDAEPDPDDGAGGHS